MLHRCEVRIIARGRRRPSKAVVVMKAIDCLNAIKTVGKDKMALLFEDLDNSDISKMVPVLVKMAGKTSPRPKACWSTARCNCTRLLQHL